MLTKELEKKYSRKYELINEQIKSMNLSDELKNGLFEVNNKLFHYSVKINSNSIKSKISFYYVLCDLRHGERKSIVKAISNMFYEYDLCYGKSHYFDVNEENPVYILENINDNDFWEVDFTEYPRASFFNTFIPDLKICCRDLIKCMFIICTNRLLLDSENEIKSESNIYKKYKYQFDYTFKVENKENAYKELKNNLIKNGFQCNFRVEDISDIKQYRDNEVFIENALIKNNILRDNNNLSFKELTYVSDNKEHMKLEKMIGLKNVKKEMKNLEYLLKFYKDINKTNQAYLNVIFKGNPGTGKTTVARNYADLLYNLGYIKNNNLVEIVPSDLMGEYVGQTKKTTRRLLRKAKGGVLFIDEAYNLNIAKEYSSGTYMREAIVELLKYMEDKSNVVIYAGYKLEMEDLLNINPGFKSRIGSIIDFEDYTTKELVQIFKYNADKYNLKCTKKFIKELEKKLEKDKCKKNFGNARYVENLLNKILYVHAANVYNNNDDLYLLNENDLKLNEEITNSFGFCNQVE